ncbi:catecholate siderophore receptor [Pseudacidovorax intermedius]|uniref:Catecholate siderophore receptor n=1 Tax=Pseudacidovorax intermedius TaxID=433924 RepID=A0A370FJG2_9BURK|nr:catecholate siderophore receptor Fiu [Pseudacidovorax intermedius]RDI27307.1 catecholate siderophore receptor [Pseudacidovorax intermedius]
MAQHIKSRKHAVPRKAAGWTGAAAATLVAIAAPAGAQTAPSTTDTTASTSTLREVRVEGARESFKADTVSSPKFTQPLVDTPQTITVIKKEVLQEQGANTLTEALRNTPGITFQMGENGNTSTGDAVFLRGFDSSGSIFVDGARDVGTVTRDMFNIEQVEVVKGPASADIGRTAPTGYINLVSKVPQTSNFFTGSVSLGSGDQKRATADINRVLNAEGTMALRLNVMTQDSGVPGRDDVKNKGWAIAPSIAFGLNTPTRVILQYQHVNQRNRPDGGIPTVGLKGYYLDQLKGIGGNGPQPDTSNYYGSLSDHDTVDGDMFTARIEHDFDSGVKLRNLTRWGRTDQDLVLTGVFSSGLLTPSVTNPLTWSTRVLPQGKGQRNEILTNQTNVTAEATTGSIKHSISAGLELAREQQDNTTMAATINAANGVRTVSGGTVSYQAYNSLYMPNPYRAFVPVLPTGATTEGTTSTAALYAFDTLKFNEQWQLTGGLRWEHYRTRFTSLAAPVNGVQTALTQEGSDNLLTGKLGLVYKPADNGSVYAAYATGAQPPGGNFSFPTSLTTANVNNLSLDPQKSKTFELGTKWDVLDKRLALSAAAFRTKNENEQVQVDTFGNFEQYGKTRVQGLELSAVGQITPAWQVIGGLARIDTKILEGSRTSTTQNGAQIRYSPKLTATLWTSYRFPFGLTVGGGVRYVSTQQRSTSNAAITATSFFPEVPSYTVWDAMVGYEINRNVSIQLNLYNLADKFYLARVNNGGNRLVMGTPRSALLSANFRF